MNTQTPTTMNNEPKSATQLREETASIMLKLARYANGAMLATRWMYEIRAEKAGENRDYPYQAEYLLGNYIYEGLQFVSKLVPEFKDEPHFAQLRDLHLDAVQFDDILFEISIHAASNPGWSDRTTEQGIIASDELPICELMASASLSREEQKMYHAVFKFDADVLTRNLNGRRRPAEIVKFLDLELPAIAERFRMGTAAFIEGLIERLLGCRPLSYGGSEYVA